MSFNPYLIKYSYKKYIMRIFLIIALVGLSIMVGNYAEEHGESKWVMFIISLLVSPLVGFIIAALNKKW